MLLYYSVLFSELGIYTLGVSFAWLHGHSLVSVSLGLLWSVHVHLYYNFFCFYELKMPPLGLLIWTENAALMVAFLNWKRRLQGCFFEPKIPPLMLLFKTENVVFRVAFLNRKCHVQGCYFESIMLPLWLLVWTANSAFRVALLNRKCRLQGCSFEPEIQPSRLLF